jgi:2-polyprenyl-6-methoxyphenol hydroxylase-like FAD-dependent oxidoreductase
MTTLAAQTIIVGAGPAGASAAYFLARAGVDVLLLDKAAFPRDKSCGDGLGFYAGQMLQEMGLPEWLTGFSPIERVLGIPWLLNRAIRRASHDPLDARQLAAVILGRNLPAELLKPQIAIRALLG